MKPVKSHRANREYIWIPANPILRTFRERILQFLPEGLNNIWFRLFGDAIFELAGALGFTVEDYLNILKFGGFATVDFQIKAESLGKMIGIDIDIDIQYNHDAADGKKRKECWIWFRKDTFASAANKLVLTADEEQSMPYDEKRDDFIGDFYSLGQRRTRYAVC